MPGQDGTMIDHTYDYGTLVPDSGTMVELESNLGTMVINSDSEDSTMKSMTSPPIMCFIWRLINILLFFFAAEHDTNPDKPKYRPQFLDHFDRKKTEVINNIVANEAAAAAAAEAAAMAPSAPPIESSAEMVAPVQKQVQQHQQQQQQFRQQQQPQMIRGGVDNNMMAAAAHHQPQYHAQPQHLDIALNSEFVSRLFERWTLTHNQSRAFIHSRLSFAVEIYELRRFAATFE